MDVEESTIEQRKRRRRERNRLAAQRCRLKKREQAINVSKVKMYHISNTIYAINEIFNFLCNRSKLNFQENYKYF